MTAMCPCCSRIFESFVDYPAVHVSEVSRLIIPKDITLPYFHAPYSYGLPDAVEKEFAGRKSLGSRVKRLFKSGPEEPVEGLGKLGGFFEYGGSVWLDTIAGFACFNRDERRLIFEQLDPYVKGLEGMVDSVVRPIVLLPNLGVCGDELLFEIPGSGYCLAMGFQTLYSLGWLESQFVDLSDERLASRLSECKGFEDVQNLFMEDVQREFLDEQKDVPRGYERVSLYIIGLRPVDTSTVRGLMSGERFRLKFAEFVFQGRLNTPV